MANYSKESERQNKALKDLMSGKEHTKEYVQVGYEGKQENLGGKTRKSELTDTMASVRMPWFCPKCDKAMKKKLDRKFWSTQGHCFDCQVELENRMRIEGTFEEYAKTKMLENQKAYLKDLEQSIDDFEKTGGKKEWFNQVGVNNPELESEKWEMGEKEFEKTISEARDFIREKRELVENAENEIQGAK
jgi:ribosomal protein L37AE/L43A